MRALPSSYRIFPTNVFAIRLVEKQDIPKPESHFAPVCHSWFYQRDACKMIIEHQNLTSNFTVIPVAGRSFPQQNGSISKDNDTVYVLDGFKTINRRNIICSSMWVQWIPKTQAVWNSCWRKPLRAFTATDESEYLLHVCDVPPLLPTFSSKTLQWAAFRSSQVRYLLFDVSSPLLSLY